MFKCEEKRSLLRQPVQTPVRGKSDVVNVLQTVLEFVFKFNVAYCVSSILTDRVVRVEVAVQMALDHFMEELVDMIDCR